MWKERTRNHPPYFTYQGIVLLYSGTTTRPVVLLYFSAVFRWDKVEGAASEASAASRDRRRRRSGDGGGGSGGGKAKTAQPPLYPGSSADARGLREMLEVPARGVTVLCVDPPAR